MKKADGFFLKKRQEQRLPRFQKSFWETRTGKKFVEFLAIRRLGMFLACVTW
jgi:hypothetical protein